jgi:hypothetical protein
MMKPEEKIVEELASEIGKWITRKTIRDLQKMGEEFMLSGDSGLENVWDEICVQVQYDKSMFWDLYDDIVHGIVGGYLPELPKHEREAIWLQTREGEDWSCKDSEDFVDGVYADAEEVECGAWHCKDEEEREEYPVSEYDIINFLVHEYVYAKASRWSNARIRAYLE